MKIARYFNTVKYLRFEQIFYRLKYRFRNIKLDSFSNVKRHDWCWQGLNVVDQSIISSSKVKFLNKIGRLEHASDWNSHEQTKIWLYNLHYFDDLNSTNYQIRENIHYDYIERWIEQNQPCIGTGWEPYPLSLRLVNWVKWFSKKNYVEQKYLSSLAQQAEALSQQLEYHILGNHLFANAKALIFAGCYLKGEEAKKHLKLGLKLLDREISEQFLKDGAHFELSPMYHCIVLWDLIELIHLGETSKNEYLIKRLSFWKNTAKKALFWLETMLHTDREVSFFNDSSIGISASPDTLFSYAEKLGIETVFSDQNLITNKASGYSKVCQGNYLLIFDHANVGPDYLPGHAHADTLSFEMSIGSQRVFVNSGTSLYGLSEERLRQRKTPAHNTVSVSSYDSSQVWSGFRVAKRAYAKLVKAVCEDNRVELIASHNGYLQQKPKAIHARQLICEPETIEIIDSISKLIESCFHLHLHPYVDVFEVNDKSINILFNNKCICNFTSSESINIVDSTYHPEFGKSIPNKKIEIPFANGNLKTQINLISEPK